MTTAAISSRPAPGTGHSPLRGPEFGSYARDEVGWLLTDLSAVALEAPVEEREEAIQSGGAHYAESLPVEYQPSVEYQALFTRALESSAHRLAVAVGIVTEQAIAARPGGLTLVSLARAGTPVGILMRRWAQQFHGVSPEHYAVSIVRGRGLDQVALEYIAARHDPASVLFVDGWTGKGAIARELVAALTDHEQRTGVRFAPDLAVLADPGSCVRMYGTRDDFLIASACLNSTVSGLVSRTVLNDRVLAPGQFHGAKFYGDLTRVDVSGRDLDAVSACFDAVHDEVLTQLDTRTASPADWSGWAAVERISSEYGIGDVNLVKPGVGEATRVLLRRVPWRILVREGAARSDVEHVLQLAAERNVPVEWVADLAYTCVGLIHPRFTVGATGADGAAVRTAALQTTEPGAVGVVRREQLLAAASAAGLSERLAAKVAAQDAGWSVGVSGLPRSTVVACDLDRTLIYSARALKLSGLPVPELSVAELRHGRPASFWTSDAGHLLVALMDAATFVPTTTRTMAQFQRVRFPVTPRYAVTANGGHLLVDGQVCPHWAAQVADHLTTCAPLGEVVEFLRTSADPSWVRKHRIADELFTYLVVERDRFPAGYLDELTAWCRPLGWDVSMQGRNVYCVPEALTKEAAVAEVVARSGAGAVLAAGDSLLDAGLLSYASRGVRPAHGELHEAGWTADHVTVTSTVGVRAGEEILARLLAAVLTTTREPLAGSGICSP